MKTTNCPCCDGKGHVFTVSERFPDDAPRREHCCHCEGKGIVVLDSTYETIDWKKCPICGADCERVDYHRRVGVQYGPWDCSVCDWGEEFDKWISLLDTGVENNV
jgi:hypothetical protein